MPANLPNSYFYSLIEQAAEEPGSAIAVTTPAQMIPLKDLNSMYPDLEWKDKSWVFPVRPRGILTEENVFASDKSDKMVMPFDNWEERQV